tara:strand:+ start:14357 stop:14620 length:264 start_codon:yes stop_codon:yes gene_type:complete
MTIVTQEKLERYRDEGTREITLPNSTKQSVRMTPELWQAFDDLMILEPFDETEVARFALEEVELQNVTFDRAFRGVVAHFANRWTAY